MAQAQDSAELGMYTVTDSRIETSVLEAASNVQVITREQIAVLPVTSVNELLQHVSGVDLRQRGAWGAQADVGLRGGSFDQTLVLVNGIKVNDPQTGHHTLNLGINLASIKQIEVIKGPAAARYGLNAFSGVINIVTEPDASNGIRIEGNAGQADNSRLPNEFRGGYDGGAAVNVGGKRMRHFISTSRTVSTGYRPNTDLQRHTINYQSILKTGFGEFNAMGSYVKNEFGSAGFYAWPIDSSSEEAVETYLAALQHSVRFGAISLKTKGYLRKNFDTYTLFRERPEVFQNRHRTDVGGAEVHGTLTHGIGVVGLGIEYRQEAISSNNLGQEKRDNFGLFAENNLRFLKERITLNTGFYLNNSNQFGTQFLPAVSLSARLSQSWNAFASWGQSFRVPTFTDLYYVGPTNLGNPDLKPEKSTNYEAGVKWREAAHFVQLSAFYQQGSDLIDWVRATENEPWQPRNYEAVATTGIDFNYELRAKKRITNALSWEMVRVNYTWLDMQINSPEQEISRYALSNLQHQVTAQSALKIWDRVGTTLTARYLDRTAYKSYWLLDARLSYSWEKVNVWADIANLLDTEYTEVGNAPLPGRWYRVGFGVNIP